MYLGAGACLYSLLGWGIAVCGDIIMALAFDHISLGAWEVLVTEFEDERECVFLLTLHSMHP